MRAVYRLPKRALSFLRSDVSLINWLRILWLATIFWCELGLFKYSVALCGWGDKQLARVSYSQLLSNMAQNIEFSLLYPRRMSCW